ncbi:MAG: MFS transporter [Planctomycetota bacterium]
MRSTKRQFFLAFMVMGSVLPYLSVFLEQRGLTMSQIGWVMSLTGVGVIISPVLTTLLADTRVQSRTLLGVLFALSGGSLAWLAGVGGFWWLLIVHGLFAVAFAPVTSLQDGLYFHRREELEARSQAAHTDDLAEGHLGEHSRGEGRGVPDYHVVRVWGTFGFILPSVVLYFVLRGNIGTTAAVWCAAVCCGAGVLNEFTLPRLSRPTPDAADAENRLPTAAAARALLEPHLLVFCIATFLLHLAITAYYSFYPVYLTETVSIGAEWIGLIANLGVTIEIGFMLGFGWFLRGLGLKRLMLIGAACMAARFALLGFLPNVGVAVGTQVFHGVMVVVIHVAPPIYLNHRADDRFRNSIQGLYAMIVFGTGRIAGNLIAGEIAEAWSLQAVFLYATTLCLVAAGLFAFAFADGIDDNC